MNLILFDPAEIACPLPCTDPRARHLLDVLRRGAGDTFDVGLVNGPRGKGQLVALGAEALTLAFAWDQGQVPLADPITLLIGLPRPQTARDILRDATTLGVAAIHFVATEKSEAGYARSTLWSSGEWRRHLLTGAAQAFATQIPAVTWDRSLRDVLAVLPADAARLALDNYEASASLGSLDGLGDASTEPSLVLALGPERGWGADDRAVLRAQGFKLAHLGQRVLRSETAVVAALAMVKARRGWM